MSLESKPASEKIKTLRNRPADNARIDKIILHRKLVCYNCEHESKGKCKIFDIYIEPDKHCFKYTKGKKVIGRTHN